MFVRRIHPIENYLLSSLYLSSFPLLSLPCSPSFVSPSLAFLSSFCSSLLARLLVVAFLRLLRNPNHRYLEPLPFKRKMAYTFTPYFFCCSCHVMSWRVVAAPPSILSLFVSLCVCVFLPPFFSSLVQPPSPTLLSYSSFFPLLPILLTPSIPSNHPSLHIFFIHPLDRKKGARLDQRVDRQHCSPSRCPVCHLASFFCSP